MPFCDLSPTQVVWNRTNSRSAVPGTNVPVFQIQMIGPREVQDNYSMSDSLHDKYRAITKISTHDAIAAAKARQDRVQKALALVSATPQVSQQRPMLGQERLRAQQTEQHVFSGSSKVTSYSDVQIVRKSLLTKPFSQAASIFHLLQSFLQAEGRPPVRSSAFTRCRAPAPRFIMVTACAINALLRYCARRTQSTLPTEIPITEDGAGPGLVERHDIDAQEYLAPQETGACLNTLELYLMLFTASCRIRLGAPELLDVLIILNSAVNGDCNITPKTMRLTLVAAIVIAAKRTQTASSSASVPSDMKIAGSAFSHLNLSRLLGTMLLVEHATDFQLAVLDDEQLRRQYTINLAKLAERERPAINMYLQRVPQMNLDIETTKNMRHDFQNTRPLDGAHSPVHSFKRARRLDLRPLSQQLLCDL